MTSNFGRGEGHVNLVFFLGKAMSKRPERCSFEVSVVAPSSPPSMSCCVI